MNLLSVENLSKRFGERLLFDNANFGILKGEKTALVAKNGAGKSTLLKILIGQDAPTEGVVTYRNGIRIGFMQQEDNFPANKTIQEVAIPENHPSKLAQIQYNKAMETPEDADIMDKALEEMELSGAWEIEQRMTVILDSLNINFPDKRVSTLSGGQKKRLSLAQILIDDPDLYIIDEPTNHLDLEMIEWLEGYFKQGEKSILMVTHDRYFLDRVCNCILELDNGQMYKYNGNYSYFMEKKAERQDREASEIDKAKNLYRKELEWMRRMPKARTTKSKSRIDSFYDVESKAKQRLDDSELNFDINITRMGSKIIEFHNVGKSFGDNVLFEKFNYTFKKGDRVGLVGKNGSGKSTLLNLIVDQLKPDSGKVVIGDTIKLGYFNQAGMNFPDDFRVIEAVKEIAEYLPLKSGKKLSASQLLERFLFPSQMHYQYVSKLSGGERKRLHLLTILMDNPNVLILDEPTNDLDVFTLTALEDFLQYFPGCLIVVSHDRYFMDKMVDHMFYFNGATIRDFPGNYSLYRDFVAQNEKDEQVERKEKKEAVKVAAEVSKSKKKFTFKEQRELELITKEMETLEAKKEEFSNELSSGNCTNERIQEVSTALNELVSKLDSLMERWMELEEKKA
ncbi:MAG: ATP-binding cassette subfamily F protein uup [Sphingobacteriales bacterium]|jgi:ATP-binding cassette subfamily F protein uup